MKNKITIFSLLVSLLGCNLKNERSYKIPLSTEIHSAKKIVLSNYGELPIDSILMHPKFLKLETRPECLIGQIDKLIVSDDLIFIMDKTFSKSIFVFNRKGMFINKISKRGKGPGEFIEVWDMNIDTSTKQIELFDEPGKKINYYNYQCEFVKKKKLNFLFTGYAKIDKNVNAYFAGTSGNGNLPSIKNELLVVTEGSKIIPKTSFALQKNEINGLFNFTTYLAPIWSFNKKVFINPRFCDTIYRVTKDSLIAEYILKSKETIPKNLREEITDKDFRIYSKKYSYLNGNFVDLEKSIYLATMSSTGFTHVFYSKKSNRIYSGRVIEKKCPLFIYFEPPIASCDNNTLVSVQSAQQIMFYRDFLNVDKSSVQTNLVVKQLFEKFNSNENPVLLFYKVKDF